MNTAPITPQTLASSVIAVPPLARNADLTLNREQNERLVRHLEGGGVTTLLYGGNAVFYHVVLSEYAELLAMLQEIAAADTLVIPSVGPAFGTMMDQAAILRNFDFPTAMVLPQKDVCTFAGIATGVRKFVEAFGKPAVLYIKHEGFIDVPTVSRLMNDGLLSWIKYAIVRDDPSDDPFLRELVDAVDPQRIVSGIGEQPAPAHLNNFGVGGFTAGCVCIAPRLSTNMLHALKAGNSEKVERLRSTFRPLEDLRNGINPVRVLHAAVTLSGIADMGPILPLLSELDAADQERIKSVATQLLASERQAREESSPGT